jgi:predicted dehydrogenase
MKDKDNFSRRDFLKTTAAFSVAAFGAQNVLFAQGQEKIRVGLIGCGGRGTGAAEDCLNAERSVELTAMADLFQNKLDDCLLRLKGKFPDRVTATKETCFVGFDAYQKLCSSGSVDVVIEATPPHFRPSHLKAAIEAGKHIFMEKPAGVDPVGIRSVIASSELAGKKGLSIVAGTQRRHQKHYIEIIKRIHDGDIGEIKAAYGFWNGGDMLGYWQIVPHDNISDMEWQCRNWPWFVWTSGDHIVEQHVHNLDVINWVLKGHPVSAMGMGGRQVRTFGNMYDHFAVEFEYPNKVVAESMCRQISGCTDRVSELFIGTKGRAYLDGGTAYIEGEKAYKYEGEDPNPYVQEHKDLINAIKTGKPINEGKQVAESTMVAIMGRISTYTGRQLNWDWAMNSSKLDLTPARYEFGDLPVEPVAVPGKTQLV